MVKGLSAPTGQLDFKAKRDIPLLIILALMVILPFVIGYFF